MPARSDERRRARAKMDCDKFEAALVDELYGELDQITSAAAKRHIAGCARCSARIVGLRATRSVAALPLVDAPRGLEERILEAVDRARLATRPSLRLSQVVSMAGSWAMRPQTAMAAVFLVMTATSVLLLRGTSARAPATAEVTVTERGTPAPATSMPPSSPVAEPARPRGPAPPAALSEARQPVSAAVPPPSGATPPTAGGASARVNPEALAAEPSSAQTDELFETALRIYRAGRFEEAARAFDALGPADPNAADLWAARSIRDGKGCRAAVGRFDKTVQRYRQAPPGWDALLEGALCYRALGDFTTARARLSALLDVDSHKDRARAELDRIDDLQQAQASRDGLVPARTSKARPAAAAAAPASVPASGAATSGQNTDSVR